jgi:type I restriction enzyme S subunit
MTIIASKTKWAERQFGDFFRIKHGYAFKGEYFSGSGDYIVLTPGNFYDEGGFKSKGDKEKYYTGKVPSGFILSKEDLIVAMTEQAEGLLGSAAIIPKNNLYLHNQRLGLITNLDKNHLDNKFLYYLFNSKNVRGQIRASANGVKVRHTSPDRIYQVKFRLPPLLTQQKIAAILSAYDDLIENNTRRIEILEEMARSIYREWFVKFRFPGHEQVQMVDSELGLIPEGWRYSSLKTLPIQFIDGDRSSNYPKTSEFVDKGIIFLNTKNINKDKIDLSEVNFITREKFEGIKKGRVQPLDIVMTTRGSIGKIALFNCEYSTALINAQMLIIRADGQVIDQIYLFYLMCSNEYQEVIKNFASGSAQPQIPIQDLKQIEILCPPIAIQGKFSEIVSSYNSLIKNLQSKNTNLRQTRDLLLPRLLSGEIDVENLDINTGPIAA